MALFGKKWDWGEWGIAGNLDASRMVRVRGEGEKKENENGERRMDHGMDMRMERRAWAEHGMERRGEREGRRAEGKGSIGVAEWPKRAKRDVDAPLNPSP